MGMARQFDFRKVTLITRSLRGLSTSPGNNSGKPSTWPPGKTEDSPVPSQGGLLSWLTKDGGWTASLIQSYEDAVGIGDVKRAQDKVNEIERHFMEVRQTVKNSEQELHNVQANLRTVRAKLDRTSRDDTKFLEYATEEHLTIQKERQMEDNHDKLQDLERSLFEKFSAAVRESHEKQRWQEARTKYWGVIGSIVGTIIGLLGSTLINQKRMRELRTMVGDLQKDIGQNGQLRDLKGFVKDIRAAIEDDRGHGDSAVDKDVKAALEKLARRQQEGLDLQEKNITKMLKQQEVVLLQEMEGVRRFAAVGTGDMTTLEELVNNAGQKLEWEIKMSTLSTVVFIYGAFALTLPILYSIFK